MHRNRDLPRAAAVHTIVDQPCGTAAARSCFNPKETVLHFLVTSTPLPSQPSTMRVQQKAFWDWLRPLEENGTAKHVYVKIGRGAVIIFEVDSHEAMHKLVNQWQECVPANFEVVALVPKSHQENIARAGTHPAAL